MYQITEPLLWEGQLLPRLRDRHCWLTARNFRRGLKSAPMAVTVYLFPLRSNRDSFGGELFSRIDTRTYQVGLPPERG